MAAGSIVIDLLMKTGSFETDTARAAKSLKKLQKEAEDIGKKIGLALTAATAGLFYLTKSAIDSQDALNDLSQKTGVAAAELGGFGFAAEQAGGSLDSVAAGLGKLNKTIAEAAAGNKEAAEFFQVLGISVRDSNGQIKKAGEIYLEVADKFATFEDGPNKAALALRAFGKAGLDQIPILNQGGSALRQQIDYYKQYSGVTDESVKKADEFNDTLTKIKLLSSALGNSIASDLLPTLQTLADAFLKAKESGDGFSSIASTLGSIFRGLVIGGAYVIDTFGGIGREIGAIAAQLAALGRGDFKQFRAISEAVTEDGKRAKKELDDLVEKLTNPVQVTIGLKTGSGPRGARTDGKTTAPGLAGPKVDTAAKQSEADRYIESLQKQLEKTQDLTTVEQILADIQGKRITGLTKNKQAEALALGARIDAAKIEARLSDEKARAQEAVFEENKRAIQAGFQETAELEKQNEAFRQNNEEIGLSVEAETALAKARIQSLITIKEGNLALQEAIGGNDLLTNSIRDQIAALKERLGLVDDKRAREDASAAAKKLADDAKALNESIRGSFEDSFVGFVTGAQTAKQAFRGFANSVISELLRIQAQKLALSIFGDGTSPGGFGGANTTDYRGTTLPNNLRGGGATGTNMLERDMITLVHKGEAIVPKAYNPAAGGMGGDVDVQVFPAPGQSVTTEKSDSGGRKLVKVILGEIARDSRRGGQMRQATREAVAPRPRRG